MSRKLASIQIINDIKPIPNADRIELAFVLGWEVVINKNEFQIGDKAVYIEVDSILPPKPEFEFLKDRKYRIRTIKLKKQISQGICFPLNILPINKKYNVGDDVTDIIGIIKYDPEKVEEEKELYNDNKNRKLNFIDKIFKRYKWYRKLFLESTKKKYSWPSFISKTDEERIQNMPEVCEKYKDIEFSATEKLDGTSCTFFIKKDKTSFLKTNYQYGVCSRNMQRKENPNCKYWKMFKQYNFQSILKNMFEMRNDKRKIGYVENLDNIVIQGEIIGPNIQGNKYKLTVNEFRVFNIKINGKLLSNSEIFNICVIYNLHYVPIVFENFKLKLNVHDNVILSQGYSLINPDIPREGIVIRNNEYNVSFKIINPEFLLKFGC